MHWDMTIFYGGWLLVLIGLLIARLLQAIDARTLVVIIAVLVVEMLEAMSSGSGAETSVSAISWFSCLNIVLLIILVIRMYQRSSTSYLWGAVGALLRSGTDTFGRRGCSLLQVLFSPLVRRCWIDDVRGLEHIPSDGACLLAFNHESYFDFICFAAVTPRRIHYLAAEKFFTHPVWKWVMRDMGCIKVDRCAGISRACLRQISDVIAEGRMVGIFPEGTRSPDGNLLRAKPGVAYLALQTGLPVIPIGLVGTSEIMSRHDRWPKLRKARIAIGPPICLAQPEQGKVSTDYLQQAADKIMVRIASLVGKEYPYGEPAHE